MEREEIELLLSQPQIVAWLGLSQAELVRWLAPLENRDDEPESQGSAS